MGAWRFILGPENARIRAEPRMRLGSLSIHVRWLPWSDPVGMPRGPHRLNGRLALLLLLLTLFAVPPAPADDVAFGLLQEPGAVLLLRHALAPGIGDPPGFLLGDCSTQRNLSEAGREQARTLGNRLRAAGIHEARVYSSRWCRCVETGQLLDLGPVQPMAALDSFFQQRGETASRTAAVRAFLQDLPPGPPVVLVTHQVNISALTGEFAGSGEGVVAALGSDGSLRVLGVVR